MSPELMQEIATVILRDVDAIWDSYAWPPRPPLSAEERKEADRLRVLASRIYYASRAQ